MSDAAQPTLLRRLRYTPLSDLVRGRVTGRLDLRSHAGLSRLPPAARELVRRVVKRTRLWRTEKADVAVELAAHFHDGLAAGEPVEDLVAAFGDERQAARLIRRAKVRSRPLAWHAVRFLRRLTVALVVVYALLGVRFLVGRPRVAVDYVAKANEPILATRVEQRAWPVYARLLIDLRVPGYQDARQTAVPADADEGAYWASFAERLRAKPGGKRWDDLCGWVDAHTDDIERLRLAAARPTYGFVLGPEGSVRDNPVNLNYRPLPNWGMMSVALPALSAASTFADVLAADMRVAVARRDGGRAVRDVEAMLALAEQIRVQFVVGQMVGLAVRDIAIREFATALVSAPGAIEDASLVRLAHALGRVGRDAPLIDLRGDRPLFYDVIQRVYTDDGNGDGRLTPEGAEFVRTRGQSWSGHREYKWADVPVLASASVGGVASRRVVVEEYERLTALSEAQLARPAREADWSQVESRLREIKSSPLLAIRYAPVAFMAMRASSPQAAAERTLGYRDGAIVGIALELHRRRTGAYPAELAQLTRTLLPVLPVDRITGGPLSYKLVGGKPLVYSVGVDRDDDSGRVVVDYTGSPQNGAAAVWPPEATFDGRHSMPDGDWVLYPQPVDPSADAE